MKEGAGAPCNKEDISGRRGWQHITLR